MSKITISLSAVAAMLVPCSTAVREALGQANPGADTAPLVQIRLARETPAPGFAYMEGAAPNAVALYVAERNIVSDEDIEHAGAFVRSYGVVLDLQLSEDAASRVREASTQHRGLRMAVLVNAQLVATPPIVGTLAVPEGRLQVGLELAQGLATRIAEAVASRWPK